MKRENRFLTAEWNNIVLLNYAVDASLLAPFVPAGTEIDAFKGKTYLSLIGFEFNRTRVLGFAVPFHQRFEEVNLRFYVKKSSRRGVVSSTSQRLRPLDKSQPVTRANTPTHQASSPQIHITVAFRGEAVVLKMALFEETALDHDQSQSAPAADSTVAGQNEVDTGTQSNSQSAPAAETRPGPGPVRTEKETMEDFATALETFTPETETVTSEDRVIKGTVVKVTDQYVMVDVGMKSEGVVPIAEVRDHEGNVTVQPGQDIDVMIEKGETEEGYITSSTRRRNVCARGTKLKPPITRSAQFALA